MLFCVLDQFGYSQLQKEGAEMSYKDRKCATCGVKNGSPPRHLIYRPVFDSEGNKIKRDWFCREHLPKTPDVYRFVLQKPTVKAILYTGENKDEVCALFNAMRVPDSENLRYRPFNNTTVRTLKPNQYITTNDGTLSDKCNGGILVFDKEEFESHYAPWSK
jgi:hypothetical protein